MIILPLQPSIPSYRVGVTLDVVNYLIDVRYNLRDASWYMDLLDADESAIVTGCRIVLGVPLFLSADARIPKGILIAHDTSNEGVDAGLDDISQRVFLEYYPPSEVDTLL